jgi:dsRNA-specific ribonuclease
VQFSDLQEQVFQSYLSEIWVWLKKLEGFASKNAILDSFEASFCSFWQFLESQKQIGHLLKELLLEALKNISLKAIYRRKPKIERQEQITIHEDKISVTELLINECKHLKSKHLILKASYNNKFSNY